ncbi:MAG: hypothetical protein ACREU6_10015 [Steroidobacteraceae bacterium]
MTNTANSKKRPSHRKYRVCYSVTRTEYYEIKAKDAEDAEDRAFPESELIEWRGETTDVTEIDVEEISDQT